MSGLIRKCRQGESFSIGDAVIQITKTGKKATVNIVAPPEVAIRFHPAEFRDDDSSLLPDPPSTDFPDLAD